MQMKSPSSSTSTKLKTLIHNLITHPVYRFIRALNKAKSILLEASKHNSSSKNRVLMMFYPRKTSKKQSKILFGSFRLHYNWCSSHVVPVPVPPPVPYPLHHNSLFDPEFPCDDLVVNGDNEDRESQLSGYLEWLEEKVGDDCINGDSNNNGEEKEREIGDDIDRLADKFIASCHEKFLLEKVESYRRFQEMLARSL
ncbi:PREDICTED: uncharacterized protein LOC104802486 [Tarenaya hassleriana]|uniref:uncharacterized protein LOC104802486 n=1 Tax=Tarenaya hassleriana TaxID=28532 RepID=UPI00053C7017|nr:PREDICTED: uncharacterized protein LOC104802486 [Tarenaya hassleriana]